MRSRFLHLQLWKVDTEACLAVTDRHWLLPVETIKGMMESCVSMT